MSDTIPATSGIYCILNEITGKIYIGSTVNLRLRKNTHFGYLLRGRHSNCYLQNSVRKYGVSNFSFHIVEMVTDTTKLLEREQIYLDETKSYERERGYNICPVAGNTLGVMLSAETRAKISVAKSGVQLTDKHKAKLSKANLARTYGHTVETKAKISAVHRGKRVSLETRKKLSKATALRWKQYYAKRDNLQLMLDF